MENVIETAIGALAKCTGGNADQTMEP